MKEADLIRTILSNYRSIAVVGVSTNPDKPSYRVAEYLIDQEYRVHLVNPRAGKIMGRRSYPDLKSIPEPVDIVDVFRPPEEVMPIVDEAIGIGAKVVWMQSGVVNEEAAARAEAAGLLVVMNRCISSEHSRFIRQHSMGDGGEGGGEGG